MRVEVFKLEHIKTMLERGHLPQSMTADDIRNFASHAPYSFSIFRKSDEELMWCGGVAEYWPGRGESWAIFNRNCREEFSRIHRIVKLLIADCPIRRIELSVEFDFENGHRWARALGFHQDAARLKAYFPDGGDATLYSRVAPCRL